MRRARSTTNLLGAVVGVREVPGGAMDLAGDVKLVAVGSIYARTFINGPFDKMFCRLLTTSINASLDESSKHPSMTVHATKATEHRMTFRFK